MNDDKIKKSKTIIGRQEYCDLPELQLFGIRAKIDSGAKTSALHAYNIISFIDDEGVTHVGFNTHPHNRRRKDTPRITLPVLGKRQVISSNGVSEERYLVCAHIRLGTQYFITEITLTSRHKMAFPLLIGRSTLIKGQFVIDVSKGYLLGKPKI